MQKIKTEPIRDRYEIAVSVMTGATRRASSVILPSKTNTGMAEKIQPRPLAEVMTAMIRKSKTDFTARVE